MNNMEVFVDIKNFEDKYQISNLGNVRSKKSKLLLRHLCNKKGYHYVNLSISKYRKKKEYIHRLVARHFIENPQNKPQVNHKDGNPANNNVENLEWCTNEENQQHAVLHNLHYKGETHKDSKFTEESIKLLPELVAIGFSVTQLNHLTGVANINIEKVINGKTWRQLGLQFTKVRKATSWDNYTIIMKKQLYLKCMKHWGNTVLNSMIAKGNLQLTD